MFVTNREKKGLLDLRRQDRPGGRRRQGRRPGGPGAELADLFQKAIAPE